MSVGTKLRRHSASLVIGGIAACALTALALPAAAAAAPPANDPFAGPTPLTGLPTSTTGTNVEATKETGEPNHGSNSGGASVWYTWTAPSNGPVEIDLEGSDFDTLLGVYTGNAVDALTLIAGNDDDVPGTDTTSRVVFNAVQTTEYRIAVDGYNSPGGLDTGSISLAIDVGPAPTPPANDDLANADVIPNTPPMDGTAVNNAGADKEPSENDHAGNAGGHSVWYEWTAPQNGEYAAYTCGVNIDSLLAVYTDADPPGPFPLTPVGSSDDAPADCVGAGSDDDGVVFFDATAGTKYKIAVDGKNGATGNDVWASLAFIPPPAANDNFANAEPLAGLTDTAAGDNLGATFEANEPEHFVSVVPGIDFPNQSIWYRWTAPQSGQATISLCDSDPDFDSVLAVYTGAALNTLARVVDADDSCGTGSGLLSRVTFPATAATTYQIAVDGYNGSDLIDLDLTLVPTVTPPTTSPPPTTTPPPAGSAACDAARDAVSAAEAKLKKAKAKLKKAKRSGDADKIKKAKAAVKKAKQKLAAAKAAAATTCGTAAKASPKLALSLPKEIG